MGPFSVLDSVSVGRAKHILCAARGRMLGKAAESGKKWLEICSQQAVRERFSRVSSWFYKQQLGEVSQPLTGAAWPTVSSLDLWKDCHRLTLIFTAILQIWGIVLYFAEISKESNHSLGNGCDLLFSTGAWKYNSHRRLLSQWGWSTSRNHAGATCVSLWSGLFETMVLSF